MKKFIKKPAVVEAMQVTQESIFELESWSEGKVEPHGAGVRIDTLGGTLTGDLGDWIVKLQGEFYPCELDKFEACYGEVSAEGDEVFTEAQHDDLCFMLDHEVFTTDFGAMFHKMREMKENNVLVYDKPWKDIPEQDEPQEGVVYVLPEYEIWLVNIRFKFPDGTTSNCIAGSFWLQCLAIEFAKHFDVESFRKRIVGE